MLIDFKQGGYTIMEVMIFLAVSGMLFIIAMGAVNGQQGRTQFNQATRDFQSKISSILSDVSTGAYNDTGNFSCTAGANTPPTIATAPQSQGTNAGCIFLGKVIQFTLGSSAYSIITVAGNRLDTTTNQEVSTIAAANPVIIPSITTNDNLENGLQVTGVYYNGSTSNSTNAVGLFASLSSYSPTDASIVPSAQKSVLMPVKTLLPSFDVYSSLSSPIINPTTTICLRDGSSGGKRAAIVIGANNRQLYTELHINDITTILGNGCPA